MNRRSFLISPLALAIPAAALEATPAVFIRKPLRPGLVFYGPSTIAIGDEDGNWTYWQSDGIGWRERDWPTAEDVSHRLQEAITRGET